MMKQKNRDKKRNRSRGRLYGYMLPLLGLLAGCSPRENRLLWETEMAVETAEETLEETAEEASEAVPETVVIQESAGEKENTYETILVHVCGAVCVPGVVELSMGSRAGDALSAAGGFAENAARDYVNLAAQVADGQQLYFPTEEELLNPDTMPIQQSSASAAAGKVNINTADADALCTLTGIGASRAQAIIDYREKNGFFAKIEDIMQVSGIKQSAYEKIRDQITVK